jgi:hypothetical protein
LGEKLGKYQISHRNCPNVARRFIFLQRIIESCSFDIEGAADGSLAGTGVEDFTYDLDFFLPFGLPPRLPRFFAAFNPAMMRSLESARSYCANVMWLEFSGQKSVETIRSQIKAAEDAGYTDRATARRMNKSLERTNRGCDTRDL